MKPVLIEGKIFIIYINWDDIIEAFYRLNNLL